MKENNVLVVGTGTIGSCLISLLARHKEEFGIDNVYFNKHTPLEIDAPQIKGLINFGAKLVTDANKFDAFKALGMSPCLTKEEAIKASRVVIDCTPQASKGKSYYESLMTPDQLFVAQGNAKSWGMPYAWGINDEAMTPNLQFVKVVSCNTHSIARIVSLVSKLGPIAGGDFLCIRRASDISQDEDMVAGLEVDGNSHHAIDACDLFGTMSKTYNLTSSACKIPSQYMHSVYFNFTVRCSKAEQPGDVEDLFLNLCKEDRKVSTTVKATTNKVFSFGRDYGHYGRILTQTVVVTPTIEVNPINKDTKVYQVKGFAFTPQDGNSLLSSVAIALLKLNNYDHGKVEKLMTGLEQYLFQEV